MLSIGRAFQAKLVKQEQLAIDAQYEKKRKGAEVAQKMYVSSLFPDSRSVPFATHVNTMLDRLTIILTFDSIQRPVDADEQVPAETAPAARGAPARSLRDRAGRG